MAESNRTEGKVLGFVPTAEARKMALGAGLDLVEVAPNVQPPVCRVMATAPRLCHP
jgi:translation initiation factor IF-3